MASGQNKSYSHKFSRDKINIIRSMDLLVIDEVSMVRADLLDAISDMLRRYRDRNKPFGGVQLLLTTISPRSEGGRMEFVERTLRLSLLF